MGRKKAKQWTAAGAARAARESRISAVKYLRNSDLAMKLEAQMLIDSYRVKLATFHGNEHAAMLDLFGGMGYRSQFSDWRSASRTVLDDEARCLAEAQLYVISPHMCDVVIAAAQSLTTEDLDLAIHDDLPSLTGLVMLPFPIIRRAVDGDLADTRALTWTTPASAFHPSVKQQRVVEHAAARISCYYDTNGPVQPDNWTELVQYARASGTPLPPITLEAVRTLTFRVEDNESDREVLRRAAAAARQLGEAKRALYVAEGKEVERVIGEYEPGSTIDDHDGTFVLKFLYAFWRLCDQSIAVHEQAPMTHSARISAEKVGAPPDVRVVQVRHAEQPAGEQPTGEGKDWQHRWIVRMHKVRQWYPSEQTHKVIYRGPYIMGPADKPLLGGETVRGLVR